MARRETGHADASSSKPRRAQVQVWTRESPPASGGRFEGPSAPKVRSRKVPRICVCGSSRSPGEAKPGNEGVQVLRPRGRTTREESLALPQPASHHRQLARHAWRTDACHSGHPRALQHLGHRAVFASTAGGDGTGAGKDLRMTGVRRVEPRRLRVAHNLHLYFIHSRLSSFCRDKKFQVSI